MIRLKKSDMGLEFSGKNAAMLFNRNAKGTINPATAIGKVLFFSKTGTTYYAEMLTKGTAGKINSRAVWETARYYGGVENAAKNEPEMGEDAAKMEAISFDRCNPDCINGDTKGEALGQKNGTNRERSSTRRDNLKTRSRRMESRRECKRLQLREERYFLWRDGVMARDLSSPEYMEFLAR